VERVARVACVGGVRRLGRFLAARAPRQRACDGLVGIVGRGTGADDTTKLLDECRALGARVDVAAEALAERLANGKRFEIEAARMIHVRASFVERVSVRGSLPDGV
jgi:hypothetical protein